MTYTDNPDWLTIFGSAWDKLIKLCPETGCFLIDHEKKTAVCDDNLIAISCMTTEPGYEEMLQITESLMNQDDDDPPLIIAIAEDSERIRAGIIRKSAKEDLSLPVCSQAQLLAAQAHSGISSVLALFRVESVSGAGITDMRLNNALTAIIGAAPLGSMIAPCSRSRYWLHIPAGCKDSLALMEKLKNSVEALESPEGDSLGLTVSAGISAEERVISERMHTAEFAFFEAAALGKGSVCLYSVERYEQQKNDYDAVNRFLTLVDNNLFLYHFQPIVSAANGNIIAYEALMRTGSDIHLSPLEILDHAQKLNRLYDIEKATIGNTLKIVGEEQEIFRDKKLFVNAITAHMLSDEDWYALEQEYGELMEKLVIELTEQTEIDSDRLEFIRKRLERNHIRLAIDDYGTGYSNTSNLLKYRPHYVKIDRTLIENIDSNPKVQKLVSGIIEFIHENGFSALAEGVETYDELKTMIGLGADLIQGYYTSRPKPVLLKEISERVREEIIAINRDMKAGASRMYHPAEGECVSLDAIAKEHYSGVFIETPNVTLEGEGSTVNMTVIIKDGLESVLTIRNISLTTEKEDPLITLGTKSNVTIICEGESNLIDRGIYVPQSAKLVLSGGGNLHILSQKENCYGIGTDIEHCPGNIRIEMWGRLYVEANGDTAVGIGGGKNECGNAIAITGGDLKINCSGNKCLGIGIFNGGSVLDISNCRCYIETSSPIAVAVGAMSGSTEIMASHYKFDIKMSGITLAAVGSIEKGSGNVILDSGSMNAVMNGRTSNCIGTRGGALNCSVVDSTIGLHCEGVSVSGIGDFTGSGDVNAVNSEMNFLLLVKEGEGFVSRGGRVTVKNVTKNITIN